MLWIRIRSDPKLFFGQVGSKGGIRIRSELRSRIRIRTKSFRIHNTEITFLKSLMYSTDVHHSVAGLLLLLYYSYNSSFSVLRGSFSSCTTTPPFQSHTLQEAASCLRRFETCKLGFLMFRTVIVKKEVLRTA